MKNKRLVSLLMAVILILTVLPVMPATAKVKTKLSVKSITMTVGDTKTIKLLNSKKGAVWSRENSNIDIISETKKRVKIKAVEEGKSIVYALVGKKEYKCKITIKEKEKPKNTNTPKPTNKPTPKPETIPDVTSAPEPEDEKYISNFTIPKQEIYNGNGVSINVDSVEKTATDVNIWFSVENNSEIEYSVYPRQYAINNLMAGGNNYSPYDIPIGKKAKFSISIEKKWLKENEIEEIKKIDIYFTFYQDYKTNWNTKTITIKTSSDDGIYYIPKGKEIYSDENVLFYLLSNSEKNYRFCLKSNLTESSYWSIENCSINDWVYDLGSCKYDLFAEPIISDKYSIFNLIIDEDFMNKNEIKSIKNIEFEIDFGNDIKSDKIKLDIKDGTVSSSIISKPLVTQTSSPEQTITPTITVEPTIEPVITLSPISTPKPTPRPTATSKPIITPEPTVAPINKTVYQDENIKIDYCGVKSRFSGYEFILLIENFTDRTLTVQVRETSINGFMVHPVCSIEVAPGKKAQDDITILGNDADRVPIDAINNIETKFHIFDWDDFDFRYETENIIIQ